MLFKFVCLQSVKFPHLSMRVIGSKTVCAPVSVQALQWVFMLDVVSLLLCITHTAELCLHKDFTSRTCNSQRPFKAQKVAHRNTKPIRPWSNWPVTQHMRLCKATTGKCR